MRARPEVVKSTAPTRAGGVWQPLCVGAGPVTAKLINGVFGDPLLQVSLGNLPNRLLFDLGDAGAVSRRVLHKVSDVFITHAHFDHICGFPDLLRARMTGDFPACRIYGPPGTTAHISGFVAGFRWDRIEDEGPELHVADIHPDRVEWSRIKVGHQMKRLTMSPVIDGVILQAPEYRIRCRFLDHGIPVLAYAVQLPDEHHIDRDRLGPMGLAPGPWIRALKRRIREDDLDSSLDVGEDRAERAAELADALVRSTPGKKLVYATDLADTRSNREALVEFASDADLFFCESTFRQHDEAQARRTQHLTTRACGEIAAAASVRRLVPFHFSKRYTRGVLPVYDEIRAALKN